MNNKLVMLFIASILLVGCKHGGVLFKKPPVNNPSDDATIKLAEAAVSVSDSMHEMARVEKVILPPPIDNTLTIPNAYNLQARASVDWSGPIEELAARIAKSAHFRLRVLGNAPSLPILISLNVKDQSLAEILRDIDYQAGKKADIHVYPNSQVVELRYAKIYS
ncbi:type IVB secretion system lipoprotein DotD [Fluoribacter dumoffii]|nr:type IVB secretion system lipoprotein DotD [Fluoribacter dumoffii]MCW8387087.1 type IVB secretion system lipoprotein DotD [Fluoribacter dumoffii]MCW8417409.1 type IVB secretion system lipoprotein DotD [Fluoribacter dumoffii]MCW8454750.1 type IVB secretion system lipoprotein DotD [Fluoribacter dumoffii]MCW8461173.1 type IVB secretion system lipoprotein DotD [Fluoribacter dumoffii]MCW8484614.1 type IVB secretion system lipoprotein DotD [Fluoribacter dumoffii]